MAGYQLKLRLHMYPKCHLDVPAEFSGGCMQSALKKGLQRKKESSVVLFLVDAVLFERYRG